MTRWWESGRRYRPLLIVVYGFAAVMSLDAMRHDWPQLGWLAIPRHGIFIALLLQQIGDWLAQRPNRNAALLLDMNATIRLQPRTVKLIYDLVLMPLLMAVFATQLIDAAEIDIVWLRLLFLVALVGLGLGFGVMMIQLAWHRPCLDLSPRGLICPSQFAGTLRWSDIRAVSLPSRFWRNTVALDLRHPIQVKRGWLGRLVKAGATVERQRLNLFAQRYGLSAAALYMALDRRQTVLGTF
jgi:hypothetical protein